jgi:lipoprotein-anchoring transpeptidase ErfK/SrfK
VIVALLSFVALNEQVAQASQEVEEKSGTRTGAAPLPPRVTGYTHVEVDLSRQRLSVVDDFGGVVKTLPVSSGSGKWFTSEGRTRRAITPRGRFTVTRKIAGWHKSPLGMLYYTSFINQGVAIHGSRSVPRKPSSHGCIRIPMSAAKEFFEATPIGTVVLVQ